MSSNGLKAVLNAVGKKQSIDQDFTLPVKNGKGSKVESKYTLGKTITGYFQIKSPGNGVWGIVVKVAGKKVVDKKGVKKGNKVNYTAKTSLAKKTTVDIRCNWSEKANTHLKIHMHAQY